MNSIRLKYYLRLLLFFIFFILNGSLKAEQKFRPITMDNGLSNFVVTSFCKDSVGFMWIGTDVSLDRFDGIEFKHFAFNSPEINKKRVKCITETTSGNIYVGNSLGLWKINYKTCLLERAFPDIITTGVSALKWDPKKGALYVGSEKGLFIIKNETPEFFTPDKNALSGLNFIAGICFDNSGSLWMTTKGGLCHFDPSTKATEIFQPYQTATGQSNLAKITCIQNTIYIGTSKTGVLSFDIRSKKFNNFIDVGSNIITDLSSDSKDLLYIATDGNGIHIASHKQHKLLQSIRYNPQSTSGIRSNSVYSLLVDRDNIIWVGFYQAGLDYSLNQTPYFNIYKYRNFDSKNLPVRSFLIDGSTKLIGTREGLYLINEDKAIVSSFDKQHLRSNLVLSICKHKGEYYIGTYGGGVSVLNPATMQIHPLPDHDFTLTNGHVFHMENSRDGSLWLATSGGVYNYDKQTNKIVSYTPTNSQIYAGNVYYLHFDKSNKGWFATENGLCIFDPSSKIIRTNGFPDGFFNKEIIKVIYEDVRGMLYFCPDKGNVFVSDVNMRNFSAFQLTARFSDRVFLSIIEDSDFNTWLGTDNGLLSIRGNKDSYYSFGFTEGIPDPVFNADASYIDKQGILWLGNSKGLLYAPIQKLSKVKHRNRKVTVTNLNVNGEVWQKDHLLDIYKTNEIKLSYNESNLLISFSGLDYNDPTTVVYEYKLEGLENEWKLLPKGQNQVTFTDLKAGNYVFVVRIEGNSLSERRIIIQKASFYSYKFWLIALVLLVIVYFSASKLIHAYKKLKLRIFKLTADIQATNIITMPKNETKYKYSKISEKECDTVTHKLTEYFENHKPFNNPDLKLIDVAKHLNCSTHTLSFIFNQFLKKNYYDYVNEYRIEEFKRRVNKTDVSKYTIAALAEECGFSSRASFFRSFKKLTGITPNEYVRSLGKKNHFIEENEE